MMKLTALLMLALGSYSYAVSASTYEHDLFFFEDKQANVVSVHVIKQGDNTDSTKRVSTQVIFNRACGTAISQCHAPTQAKELTQDFITALNQQKLMSIDFKRLAKTDKQDIASTLDFFPIEQTKALGKALKTWVATAQSVDDLYSKVVSSQQTDQTVVFQYYFTAENSAIPVRFCQLSHKGCEELIKFGPTDNQAWTGSASFTYGVSGDALNNFLDKHILNRFSCTSKKTCNSNKSGVNCAIDFDCNPREH